MTRTGLLADFHVHTRYSDGVLPMRQVVDLFGESGHDVIAITDHIAETSGFFGRAAGWLGRTVTPFNAQEYFEEIASEGRRAWERYRMIVIPGAEMTHNRWNPAHASHILALGITEFLSADRRPLSILREIRGRGAVSVACHPHRMKEWWSNTFYLWDRRHRLARHIDRWEVGCRWDYFGPVARAGLPTLANGDFHRKEHLHAWKTIVPSARTAAAVLDTLRGPAALPVLLRTPERAGRTVEAAA